MGLETIKNIIREYGGNLTYEAVCPLLAAEDNKVTWEIEHGLSTTNVVAGLFNQDEDEVEKVMEVVTPNKIRIIWSSQGVDPGTYSVLVVSGGATSGLVIDSEFSFSSMNAVRNSTITQTILMIEQTLHNLNSGTGAE